MLLLEGEPTAIFEGNDEMAAGALSAAHMNRVSVPEELGYSWL
jgi:DNA-binding LacI/PurR family transcriptional regulator